MQSLCMQLIAASTSHMWEGIYMSHPVCAIAMLWLVDPAGQLHSKTCTTYARLSMQHAQV